MRVLLLILSVVLCGLPTPTKATAGAKYGIGINNPVCPSYRAQALAPREQAGTISIEGDIYMIVNTQGFAVTVKTVRIYTDASKTTFVMGLEGCANPYCSYNLVIAGLATGTYFVEVETYSSTFFSDWVAYE